MASHNKKNTAAAIVNSVLSAAAQFILQPIIAREVPVGGVNLVNLAGNLINYVSLLTVTLNAALGRFVLHALVRKETEKAEAYVASALIAVAALASLVLVIGTPFALNVERFVTTPADLVGENRLQFLYVLLAYAAFQLRSVFQIGYFATHRMYLQQIASLVETGSRLAVTLALFALIGPRLSFVGLGTLVAAVLTAGIGLWQWRRLLPEVRFRAGLANWDSLRQLTAVGSWTLLDQVGMLLQYQSDNFLANRLTPLADADRYSAAVTAAGMIRIAAGRISSSYNPQFVTHESKGEQDKMHRLAMRRIREQGLLLAPAIGGLCGFGPVFFPLWMGSRFGDMWLPALILVAPMTFNLSLQPLAAVYNAKNMNRWPAVSTLAAGAATVGLALLLAPRLGIVGIALAVSIAVTARVCGFIPWYVARLLDQSPVGYYRAAVPGLLGSLLTGGAAYGLTRVFPIHSVWAVLGAGAVLAGVYFAVLWPNRRQLLG